MDNINQRVNAHATEWPMTIDSLQDFEALRAPYITLPQISKITAKSGEAPVVRFPGQDARVLVNEDGTAGNMVIFELFVEPGFGAPNHHQPDEDEFWYVLEGQLEI